LCCELYDFVILFEFSFYNLFQACPLAVVVLDARCRVTFKWMSRITTSTGSSSSSGSNANINDRRHQYMNENDGHSSSSMNSNHTPAFDIDKVCEAGLFNQTKFKSNCLVEAFSTVRVCSVCA
jgi:hypothetical protein